MAQTQSTPATKDRLRAAALMLFARHGYDGVSMRMIADAVGLRQSAIYNHFAAKQDLLVDLMVTHMERVLTEAQAALEGVTGPEARLEAFCRFHVSNHIDHPQDVFIAYMEIRSLEPEGRAELIALRNRYEGLLRDILSEGARDGTFALQDPALLTRALLAMLTGVTVWFREDGPQDKASVVEGYLQAALQAAGISRR